jgi:hypothetical protein
MVAPTARMVPSTWQGRIVPSAPSPANTLPLTRAPARSRAPLFGFVGGAGAVEGGSSETEIAADDDTSGADSVSRWCGRHRHWQPQGLPDRDEFRSRLAFDGEGESVHKFAGHGGQEKKS